MTDPRPTENQGEAVPNSEHDAVDHEAVATVWVEGAQLVSISADTTLALATIAQVHATLALVAQHRLANQIAYLNAHPGVPSAVIRAQIEKGIGL